MSQVADVNQEGLGEDSARRAAVVQRAMSEISHIATLPEITLKIIKTVEDPKSTASDLHEIIANDPALCARILKLVNSAFYGLPGQIGSINRAIVLLGLNAVKNIAIAASLAKLFRGGRISPNFSAKDLWKYSIAVGAAVRLLAEKVGRKLPDEAFLAGLMHDIGVVVELQAERVKLVEALELKDREGISLLQAEQKVMGATHQDFGRALCDKWKFPKSFAYVCGFHHTPMAVERDIRTLVALVHVGTILAARHDFGFPGVVESTELDPEVMRYLELTDTHITAVSEKIPEAYEVADQLLG